MTVVVCEEKVEMFIYYKLARAFPETFSEVCLQA